MLSCVRYRDGPRASHGADVPAVADGTVADPAQQIAAERLARKPELGRGHSNVTGHG